MGELQNSPLADKTCEVWMGPTGDTVYHFHNPYPDLPDNQTTIGPHLGSPQKVCDPGFAFLFARATNPFWHPIILNSFADHFKKTTLYSGNVQLTRKWKFSEVPKELTDIHQKLLYMGGQSLEVGMPIYPQCDKRFLAKFALGLGTLFLEKSFLTSEDALCLRRIMWTKQPSELEKSRNRIISVLEGRLQELKNKAKWTPGHIIALLPDDENVLNLFLILYGESVAAVRISYNPKHWDQRIQKEGLVYVVAPGLRRYVGPVDIEDYTQAREGNFNIKTQELSDLFKAIQNLPPPPPFDI